jgi:pimeloyl-ACP methyl ester carboxylesterase
MFLAFRLGALALGLICAGLGCYAAWEFALKLEGEVTYLVLAAPVIAGAAASIPVLAEATWRARAYFKALVWWAALVPAGAVVFFSAAERVHVAKAGAQAEHVALRSVASRAQATLTKADAELASARAAANQARGLKKCGTDCRSKLAAETTAQAVVNRAREELLQAEKLATTESPLQAPVWLLPAALDVVAFLAIWTGLSPARSKSARRVTRAQQRRPKRRARTSKAASAKALVRSALNGNYNVVRFGPR